MAQVVDPVALEESALEQEREWMRTFWSALSPYHQSVYVNFLIEEGPNRVRAAYGGAAYDRLRALKGAYDPGNLFRLNQDIPPAAPDGVPDPRPRPPGG